MPGRKTLTIGIKALNEERHIAQCLSSAVAAAAPFGGEVILADSGSVDRTIEIALRYPVRIVQLADPAERSCGTGAQLAFQQARGDYFYLLDGDMALEPEFLPAALAYLEAHPDVAGVGGIVNEANIEGEEFQIRRATLLKQSQVAERLVDRLDCGGLYRTSALRQAGYFADRNLHAFEEFELGARLRALGWKLARLDVPAIDHHGHTMGGYALMWRRIKSGYSGAPGEVLRGAIGKPHLRMVLSDLGHVRIGLVVIAWWVMLIAVIVTRKPVVALALLIVPWLFLSFRRGTLRLGLYSLAGWNVSAMGLITGFFRKRKAPSEPIAAIVLSPSEPLAARSS